MLCQHYVSTSTTRFGDKALAEMHDMQRMSQMVIYEQVKVGQS